MCPDVDYVTRLQLIQLLWKQADNDSDLKAKTDLHIWLQFFNKIWFIRAESKYTYVLYDDQFLYRTIINFDTGCDPKVILVNMLWWQYVSCLTSQLCIQRAR